MAETRTREALVARAVAIVTVQGSAQAADAEDIAVMDDFVDGVLASLAARNIVFVPDDDAIPTEQFELIATCLAETPAVARRFGRAADDAARRDAEEQLRVIARAQPMRLLRHDPMFRRRGC